jgi:hypothetical protein
MSASRLYLARLQLRHLPILNANANGAAVDKEHARALVALSEEHLSICEQPGTQMLGDGSTTVVAGAAEDRHWDVPDALPVRDVAVRSHVQRALRGWPPDYS